LSEDHPAIDLQKSLLTSAINKSEYGQKTDRSQPKGKVIADILTDSVFSMMMMMMMKHN